MSAGGDLKADVCRRYSNVRILGKFVCPLARRRYGEEQRPDTGTIRGGKAAEAWEVWPKWEANPSSQAEWLGTRWAETGELNKKNIYIYKNIAAQTGWRPAKRQRRATRRALDLGLSPARLAVGVSGSRLPQALGAGCAGQSGGWRVQKQDGQAP